MRRLTIYDRRGRALVAAADPLLWPAGLRRVFRRRDPAPPQRILCCRLERIGDLLMAGPALAELRALAPGASFRPAVATWNPKTPPPRPGCDPAPPRVATRLPPEPPPSPPLSLP